MTVSCPPVHPRLRRRIGRLPVLAILAALAGCGKTARVEIPAELPLRMHDQLFAIEWALQREPSVVRGVGRVTPSIDSEARLTLGLFGLDAGGRIVSRGTAHLHSDFASRSIHSRSRSSPPAVSRRSSCAFSTITSPDSAWAEPRCLGVAVRRAQHHVTPGQAISPCGPIESSTMLSAPGRTVLVASCAGPAAGTRYGHRHTT